MKAKELIKLLKGNGWIDVSQNGSHLKLRKENKIEIVPIHSRRYSYWKRYENFKENRIVGE